MANTIPQKYKDDYVKIKLTNVPVRYVHLSTPDLAFGGNKFHMQMLLDDQTAQALEAEGFKLKEKEEKDGTITKNILQPKKNGLKKDGSKNEPPRVVGPDGRTAFTEPIGNGSEVNALLSCRAWKVQGKWILSAYIEAVQVVKHVELQSSAFEDLTGGESVPF